MGPHVNENLKKAIVSKQYKEDARKAIREGKAGVDDILESFDLEKLKNVELVVLLKEQSNWGKRACVRFMQGVGLRYNKRVGELTDRQRKVVVDGLRQEDHWWSRQGPL